MYCVMETLGDRKVVLDLTGINQCASRFAGQSDATVSTDRFCS